MQKGSLRYVAGITVILAAFGLLIMGSMRSNTLRAMPVDELMAQNGQSMTGQHIRISGYVGGQPLRREELHTAEGTVEVKHFEVVYNGEKVAVEYQDALPETFEVATPVQVEGIYTAPGKMEATRVLTKCPSKYQAEQAEKANQNREAMKDAPAKTPAY